MTTHTMQTKETNITHSPTDKEHSEIHLQAYSFSGQLPPPEYFEHYGKVSPDAPKVILDLAVRQQEILASRDMEEINLYKTILENNSRYAIRGQWFAFFSVLGFFALVALAIFRDQSWVAGTALSLTALGYIVKLFVQNPIHDNRPNRESDEVLGFKQDVMDGIQERD